MWTAAGDSVRLPDGQLLPKTLGGLRALGETAPEDNDARYDDGDGPRARNCRYPDLLFRLDGTNLPKKLPDSAPVASIEINIRRHDPPSTRCRNPAK
jgi:hypothetical protein